MSDCFCDYDLPSFWSASTPRAAKAHRCEECERTIEAGEPYERVVGKWDGDICTFRTCRRCVALRQWVQNNVPCLCWAHGNLFEDCRYAVEEASFRAPDETAGLVENFAQRLSSVRQGMEIAA